MCHVRLIVIEASLVQESGNTTEADLLINGAAYPFEMHDICVPCLTWGANNGVHYQL